MLPKILICAPQSDIKNYCFDAWLKNVKSFIYPQGKYDIFLADNSATIDNYNSLLKQGIKAAYIPPDGKNIYQLLAESHNACKKYFLSNGYDLMLHLETDVFPDKDIIIKLLTARKRVIGAPYCIEHGDKRKSVIQDREMQNIHYLLSYFVPATDHEFMDGTIKQCHSVGLGCVLITKKVAKQINFRYQEGAALAPDVFFAIDCAAHNIPVYVHTGEWAMHMNRKWN